MTDVNNIEMISAKTLTMLVTEVPLTKASRYLKLLVDSDLIQFREYVEKKLRVNEDFIQTLENSTGEDSQNYGNTKVMKVNISSVKTECLLIFEIMVKIDKTLAKREMEEAKAKEKASGKKRKKILNLLNEDRRY